MVGRALHSREIAVQTRRPVLPLLLSWRRGKEGVMELLRQTISATQVPLASPSVPVTEEAQRAARRSLRAQIARLERELADAFVTAYPMGGLQTPPERRSGPRMLDLG